MQTANYNFQQTKSIFMKKVLVMATVLLLSGGTVSMAQNKKPMKKKSDSTMTMKDTSMMHSKKPMKMKKPMKPMKDSMM